MAVIIHEKEINRQYEESISTAEGNSYHLLASVRLKFMLYAGEGLLLETAVADEDAVQRFLPAIKRGLLAGMSALSISGLKAIWLDASPDSEDAADIALSCAAALALRDALSDARPGGASDTLWLKQLGLYTEDDNVLDRYRSFFKGCPWAYPLYMEYGGASGSKRLEILRRAAATGNHIAKMLLITETDDEQERFELKKEFALKYKNESDLVEVCQRYENGLASDSDAVECYIALGDVYRDGGSFAEMGEAYEKAWSHACQLGISGERYISAFAERVGDMFANRSFEQHDTKSALRWYARAGADNWDIRVKSALLTGDADECIYLGSCYANGIAPAAMDEALARRLYLAANTRLSAAFAICGKAPRFDELQELLGDLYARKSGRFYSYDDALRCYKFAAKTRPTVKEKALRLIREGK